MRAFSRRSFASNSRYVAQRGGRDQQLSQIAFWATPVLWCTGFGVFLGRMVGD
jgi:hypothetical protein